MYKVKLLPAQKKPALCLQNLIALALITLMLLCAATGVNAGLGKEIRIAYFLIDTANFQDKRQFLVADIANDTLSQHIERQFGEQASAFAYVERIYDFPPGNGETPLATLLAREETFFVRGGFDMVVVANLEAEEQGYLIRVTTVDLRPGPGAINWRGTPSLAVLDPGGSFTQIETEMEAIAQRIALRYTGRTASTGLQFAGSTPVLFWCIQSANRGNPELEHISRLLTLELPYFLTQSLQGGGTQYEITGISARDYTDECTGRSIRQISKNRSYLDVERYAYVVSGVADLERDVDANPSISVKYLIDSRAQGYSIPRTIANLPVKLDDRALRNAAQQFLRIFTSAVQLEQIKNAQSGLSSLGLYESSIDGILGPGTRQAIEAFQSKYNLEPTGTMTPEFVETLRRVTRPRN